MSFHLTSIIPLSVSLVLLTIGLVFGTLVIQAIAGVIFLYGCYAHTNNVAAIRRANYIGKFYVGRPYR